MRAILIQHLLFLESWGRSPAVPILLWLFVALAVFGWIYAIVDVARSNFKKQNDKITWMMVVIFLNFAGATAYWIFGRRRKADTPT